MLSKWVIERTLPHRFSKYDVVLSEAIAECARRCAMQSTESLVVVEVSSEEVCDTGEMEEVELHWKQDQRNQDREMEEICSQIKHVFQRTARECKDVKFVAIDVRLTASMICARFVCGVTVGHRQRSRTVR